MPIADPEIDDVLNTLGYETVSAPHNQRRLVRAGLCCFVGHAIEIWRWLHITGQFTHPTIFIARD